MISETRLVSAHAQRRNCVSFSFDLDNSATSIDREMRHVIIQGLMHLMGFLCAET